MESQPLIIGRARAHGVSDEDMLYVWRNPMTIHYLETGESPMWVAVGLRSGGAYPYLEVGVIQGDDDGRLLVIHAMQARPKYLPQPPNR